MLEFKSTNLFLLLYFLTNISLVPLKMQIIFNITIQWLWKNVLNFKIKIFYILEIKPLPEVSLANTFSYTVGSLSVLIMVSLAMQKFYDSTQGRQTIQLKNGQRTWTDTSPRRTHRGPRDIWKRSSHSQGSYL